MVYQPEPFPDKPELIPEYLRRQLELIAANLSMVSGVHLDELHVAPAKPRTGMIVLADGTDWNPGNGQGVYGYYASAWNILRTVVPIDNDGFSTFLGANTGIPFPGAINLVNTGLIGAAGEKWRLSFTLTVYNNAGQAFFSAGIWNGTNYLVSSEEVNPAANQSVSINAEIEVTLTAPTTFYLRAITSGGGSIALSATIFGGLPNATGITAERIA